MKHPFPSLSPLARNLRIGMVLILSLVPAIGTAQYKEVLELFVGQTQILNEANVIRVAIGNGKLVDANVLPDNNQVLLLANKEGITDLRIWRANGTMSSYMLRILQQSPEEIHAQIQAHLQGIEGVGVRLVGDKVLIEGYSLREEDQTRVAEIAKQFPSVSNYVTPGGIALKNMILLDVKVVEINKTAEKDIGIQWDQVAAGPQFGFLGDFSTNDVFRPAAPDSIEISGQLPLDAGSSNAYFGLTTLINSSLKLLVKNGVARFLAEPKLVCKSGGKAEFLVGGELPIPFVDGNNRVTVTYKQYGIILNISPVSDRQGMIAANVEVEVSSIDPSNRVLNIPGFLTRRTQTEVNVNQGQSIVLSGLLTSRDSKDAQKVPGLGHVPVLGELFKSRNFQNNQTDLMVFVTPSLITADSQQNKDMLQGVQQAHDEADKSLKFSILD